MADIVERLRILQRASEQIASRVSGEGEAAEIYRTAADEIERLRADAEAMRAIWRTHKCNARSGSSVGQCIDEHGCNCSCGLFIPKEGEK